MAKKLRMTRKRLKQDEVRSYWFHLLQWMGQNGKTLAIGIAAVVVAAILGLILQQRRSSREIEVTQLVATAQFELANAMASRKADESDRYYMAAEEKLRTVVDMHRRSQLAPQALFLLGNIAFLRNDYEEAARLYQEYVDLVDDPLEKADGYIALGYTYENQFFWSTRQEVEDRVLLDKALQSYQDAENLTSGTFQSYLAMLGRARLYDLHANQTRQAIALYERIARERQLPAPQLSEEAQRSRYAWLVRQMVTENRLFTLAETARLRLDQLQGAD